MPLHKTQKGWMWGGQGPFPTKAKALAVARAAYAHGYKDAISTNQQQMLNTRLQEPKKQT